MQGNASASGLYSRAGFSCAALVPDFYTLRQQPQPAPSGGSEAGEELGSGGQGQEHGQQGLREGEAPDGEQPAAARTAPADLWVCDLRALAQRQQQGQQQRQQAAAPSPGSAAPLGDAASQETGRQSGAGPQPGRGAVGKLAEWVIGLFGAPRAKEPPRGKEQQGLERQQAELPQRREEQQEQPSSGGGSGDGGGSSNGSPLEPQQAEQERADVLPVRLAASSTGALMGRLGARVSMSPVAAPRRPCLLATAVCVGSCTGCGGSPAGSALPGPDLRRGRSCMGAASSKVLPQGALRSRPSYRLGPGIKPVQQLRLCSVLA
jgi:hypothetical protein